MPAVRRILVAVKDPGSKTLPAVEKGARLAHAFGASVELFHAITDPIFADAWFFAREQLQSLQKDTRARYLEQLETLAAPLRAEGLTVSVRAEWDFPAHEAIVRRARRAKADLIVAESHAGKRLTPWLLHLTDWELLRTSPVPVLVVKNARRWTQPSVLAAIDPAHTFAKPAKLDDQILSTALAFSRALKGPLHVMHSYVPIPIGAAPTSGALSGALGEVASAMQARAKQGFDRALAKADVPRNRQHLVQGMPFDTIPAVASRIDSSIVVMGAVSRSGLKRVFIGNTAERVLNSLQCDVLVVKPAKFSARIPSRGRGTQLVGLPVGGMAI